MSTRQGKITILTLCAMLFALCYSASAQQPKKVPLIGYLSPTDAATDSARAEGIRLALRELGYVERQNIAIEYRYAEGKRGRESGFAAELVRLKVDIIVVAAGDPWIQAAKNATKTITIVWRTDLILLGQAMLKALLVPAATLPALQTLPEN